MQDVPAWAALLTTLLGGAGVKALDKILFQRRKGREQDTDAAQQIREELRGDIDKLKVELRGVEADLDKWKDRYYVLRDAYNTVKSRCKQLYGEVEYIRKHMRDGRSSADGPSPADTFTALQFDDADLDRIDAEIGEEGDNGDGNARRTDTTP